MKLIGIFAPVKNKLLSLHFEGEEFDEFAKSFEDWQDPEYLEEFFEQNKNDLQSGFYGNISVEDAIFGTIEEAESFESQIREIAESNDKDSTLENLVFKTLHKDVYDHIHIPSKAYGTNNGSWLRLYAIRIAADLYVVTGGTIKLTDAMNGVPHLDKELAKLKVAAEYLKEIGLVEEDDYELIEITSDEK